MMKCKVCRGKVSHDADTCPHCGAKDPCKSPEVERIEAAIERLSAEESGEVQRYQAAARGPLSIFRKKDVKYHVDRANVLQRQIVELRDKLIEAEKHWWDENRVD